MEDHEWAVVAGIQQGVGVALTTIQLRTGQDFHRVELVGDFMSTKDAR